MSFFLPLIIWAFIDSLISICSMAIRNKPFIRIGLILFSSFVRSNKCIRYLTYCTIDVKSKLLLSYFIFFMFEMIFPFWKKNSILLFPSSSSSADNLSIYLFFNPFCAKCHFLDLGKQCRPRSEAAERRVWSGSTLFASFAYRNQIWK